MKKIILHFGRLRLVALMLTFLPLAALPLAGVIWLWQTGYIAYWLLLLAACGGLGYLLHGWLIRRDQRMPFEAITGPDAHWSPTAEGAWQQVEDLAAQTDPASYSLSDGSAFWQLTRETLQRVAGHFHPEKHQPLLELTVPHTLLIIERASRELRNEIADSLPFSHRLTLGTLVRARRWQETVSRYHDVFRVGRALVSPASAVYQEFSRAVGGRIMGYGSERLQRWLLQEYVRKVGFYAIELYSGNLLLSGDWPSAQGQSPLRLLVLGRAGTGKSTLLKALAEGQAEPSPKDDGKQLEAWRLSSPEWGELLLWDTPAWETLSRRRAKQAVTRADMIFWVSQADNLDAEYEAGQLRRLQRWLSGRGGQPEPPLLVVLTHSEGAADPAGLRAAAASKLRLPEERIITVSLVDPYNNPAAEQLRELVAIHHLQATRSQYWRHFQRQRRDENRQFTAQQLRSAGGRAWRMAKGVFSRRRVKE